MKSIKLITSDCKNVADIAKDLMGTAIPFVKGFCALISLVSSRLDQAYKIIKSQTNKLNIKSIEEDIDDLIEKVDDYTITGDQDTLQKTVDYYIEKTNGKVTTAMVKHDILKIFDRIIQAK